MNSKVATGYSPLAISNQYGQSLLEVIIAMTVGILVVVALVFATIFSLRNAAFAKNSAQATKLAQEGIERVRLGRDRDSSISILGSSVTSWNGNSVTWCSGSITIKSDSIWCYPIRVSGGCDNPSTDGKCYFNIDPSGVLTPTAFAFVSTSTVPFPTLTESVSSGNQVFKRMILLSDDASSYQNQKTATVIVRWTDFAGSHESRLTTILRKL